MMLIATSSPVIIVIIATAENYGVPNTFYFVGEGRAIPAPFSNNTPYSTARCCCRNDVVQRINFFVLQASHSHTVEDILYPYIVMSLAGVPLLLKRWSCFLNPPPDDKRASCPRHTLFCVVTTEYSDGAAGPFGVNNAIKAL